MRYSTILFLISAPDGVVVNAKLRPLYPREKSGTHCIGGWVGPRAGLDGCGKSRPPHPPRFDPRTVQPVVASRYTDCAIPALPVGFNPGEKTRYPLYRRLGGPRGRSVKGSENLVPNRCSNADRPARGYTDWAISATRFERDTSRKQIWGSTATSLCPIHQPYSANIPPKTAKISNFSGRRVKKCQSSSILCVFHRSANTCCHNLCSSGRKCGSDRTSVRTLKCNIMIIMNRALSWSVLK